MKKGRVKYSSSEIKKKLKNDWLLYAMLIPVLTWYLLFCYLPMGGITLAFKNFRFDGGIWGSPWVGLKHFKAMFANKEFIVAFKNTIIFSLGKLLFHFPVPILVAVLLNEIRAPKVKKCFRLYLPFHIL
ncbi:MAG: hypothetical protein ACTTKY_04820 [Catonella sp.]